MAIKIKNLACSIINRECVKDDNNCYDCLIYALQFAGARINYKSENYIYCNLIHGATRNYNVNKRR